MSEQQRIYDYLRDLVLISSTSQDVLGVNRVVDYLTSLFAQIDFKAKRMQNPRGKEVSGDLIVFNSNNKKALMTLICHSDTLSINTKDKPKFKGNLSDHTLKGPGVIDNKGGIIVIYLALAKLQKKLPLALSELPFSIQVLCSPNEELGSSGWHLVFKDLAKTSKFLLGFEPAFGENGSVVKSRRGNRWYKINCHGREAHSGRAHKDGLNANLELCKKILEIQKLNDYSKNVTVNFGSIQTEKDVYNLVAGNAHAKLDLRFSLQSDLDSTHKEIMSIVKKSYIQNEGGLACDSSYEIVDDCPAMPANSASADFVKRYCEILSQKENKPIEAVESGGAADICYMYDEDKICLDGLGPVGIGMHTEQEGLYWPSVFSRSDAMCDFLFEIVQAEYRAVSETFHPANV